MEIILAVEKEEEYQKLVYLMKCIEYMTDLKQKENFYRQIAMQFRELIDYKDSTLYADICLRLAKSSKKEYIQATYNDALLKKTKANKADDYKEAADLFKQIPGYKDADALALECDKISSIIMKKKSKRLFLEKFALTLSVIGLILLSRTSLVKYYMANVYMYVGSYPSAIERYEKLGAYRDSKERLIESRYLKAGEDAANKDYKAAAKEYAAIGDYKDSEKQLVSAQKNIIKSSKPGKKIKIGKHDWVILDVDDNKALLMKYSAVSERPFSSETANTTWENSTLREWLNSDFYNNSFSETERSNIQLTEVKNNDNMIYNTPGGKDTLDYIFILSIQEARDYSDLFPDFKSNTWLRSPGAYPNTAAFLSETGEVMDFGYIVTSNAFKVRPVMWYKLY